MEAFDARDGVGGLNVVVCTSFSPKGYKLYGKRFLESYIKHWLRPIVVFHDGAKPDFRHALISYRDLEDDKDAVEFRERFAKRDTRSYRFQAVKFSRKVFAISNMRHWASWVLWFDADVVFTKDVDEQFFEKVCPENASVSYLGRPQFRHTETGFIGFDLHDQAVARLIWDMRSCYIGGEPEVFTLPEWHDSMVFDLCLSRSRILAEKRNNLVGKATDIHVWPETILGKYSAHQKGPRRKEEVYGRSGR